MPPPPMFKPANEKDRSMFYKFHDDNGHSITQCRNLKNQVEELVRNRYMYEFTDRGHLVINHQYVEDEQVKVVDWKWLIVRVIVRGLTIAGDSNRARKNYSRYASAN